MGGPQAGAHPKHVAILTERPGGATVCSAALHGAGYRVSEIAAGPDLPGELQRLGPDIVLKALDRPGDGRLEGLLELLGIAYTHSGVLSTALAAHRHQAKIVFRAAGLPVTDHVVVGRAEAARAHQLPPPYVVKAVKVGSGAAPIIVRNQREAPPQALLAPDWQGGETVMVERYVAGRTLAVAVMGNVALAVSEVTEAAAGPQNQHVTPAQISPNIYEKLQKMSLQAHEVLGCRGVTRTNFRCTDQAGGDSGLVLLDVDVQPDLSPTALVPVQAGLVGHRFEDLVVWMVEDAGCNR